MRKKIIGIVICTLVIAAVLVPMAGSANLSSEHISTDPYYGTLNPQANFAFSEKGSNLDNWGITDSVSLGGASEAKVRFLHKYDILSEGGSDIGYMKISDNGGSSWTTLWDVQGKVGEWQQAFFELNNWLGKTILIGFQYVTGANSVSQGWSVDKIVIEADGEKKYEEDFEDYDEGDPWDDWVIRSDLNPENKPPYDPTIDGPSTGKENQPSTFQFQALDPDLDLISYYIEWGDGAITSWTEFFPSGSSSYHENHTWAVEGTYTIRAKAKDVNNAESGWTEHQIKINTPRNRQSNNILLIRYLESLFEQIFKSFPILNKVIDFPVTI